MKKFLILGVMNCMVMFVMSGMEQHVGYAYATSNEVNITILPREPDKQTDNITSSSSVQKAEEQPQIKRVENQNSRARKLPQTSERQAKVVIVMGMLILIMTFIYMSNYNEKEGE